MFHWRCGRGENHVNATPPVSSKNDFDWLPRRVARPGTNQTLDSVISVQFFDKKSNKSARVTIVPDPDSLAIIFSSSSRLLGFIGHFQIFVWSLTILCAQIKKS